MDRGEVCVVATQGGLVAILVCIVGVAYALIIIRNRHSLGELLWTIGPALLLAALLAATALSRESP